MGLEQNRILALPPAVVAQIRSSTTITSLNGTFIELLKNALDAKATKIHADIDYLRGSCVIEDDGRGILSAEFEEAGGLGRLHYTSKYSENTQIYGRRGVFLASLASLSLLTITSQHTQQTTSNTVTFHHSSPISRLLPAPEGQGLSYYSHGTRVSVHDLFGNMPVRVKQRGMLSDNEEGLEKQWEELRKKVVGLLLAWGKPITLRIQDKSRGRRLTFRTPKKTSDARNLDTDNGVNRPFFDATYIRLLLSQAGHISISDSRSWRTVSARTPRFSIRGLISLKAIPTKHVQFLSFGIHPVYASTTKNVLYEEINGAFALSSFGTQQHEQRPGDTRDRLSDRPLAKALRRDTKGIDRWPMFYLRIDAKSPRPDVNAEEEMDRCPGSELSVEEVADVLRSMLFQFLRQNDLQPQAADSRRDHNGIASVKKRSLDRGSSDRLHNENDFESANTNHAAREKHSELDVFDHIKLPRVSAAAQDSHFSNWSRIKGGSKGGREDLCSGLPRSRRGFLGPSQGISGKRSPPSSFASRSRLASGNSPTFPLESGSGDVPVVENGAGTESTRGICSLQLPFTAEEQMPKEKLFDKERDGEQPTETEGNVLLWADPQTGKTVPIDARTGSTINRSRLSDSSRDSTPLSSRPASGGSFLTAVTETTTSHPELPTRPAPKTNSWVSKLLEDWENPVFRNVEEAIPVLASQDLDLASPGHIYSDSCDFTMTGMRRLGDVFGAAHMAFSGKLSKDALRDSEVLGQVDQKYILLKIKSGPGHDQPDGVAENLLVIVDQHAADERCRIEDLFGELCSPPAQRVRSDQTHLPIQSAHLSKAIRFGISSKESHLFQRHRGHFASWGIAYKIRYGDSKQSSATAALLEDIQLLIVTALPPTIAERCRVEPKLLVELLRSEVWNLEGRQRRKPPFSSELNGNEVGKKAAPDSSVSGSRPIWLDRIGSCPQKMVDMLNSRACRSAVMFNDPLSLGECKKLINRLAGCYFPFQCAHGRPSVIPIANLNGFIPPTGFVVTEEDKGGRPSEQTFATAFDAWQKE